MKRISLVVVMMVGMLILACPSARAELVAEYIMNEGSGTTVSDTGGNGNMGAFAGSGLTWVTGPTASYGTAVDYTGAGYVNAPDSASLDITSQISIAMWVNTDPAETKDNVLWKIGAYQVFIQNQVAYITLTGVTGGANAASFALTDNAWHHIAFTYDGNDIRGYLEGVLQNTTPATGAISTSVNSLRIGWDNDSAHYKGTLDNIRIYDHALSLSEVQADKDATHILPPPPGLTSSARSSLRAEYIMNEGSGTTANDTSDHGNTGAFAGTGLTWVPGPTASYGIAVDYTGGGYVNAPDSASLDITSKISIAMWVNTDPAEIKDNVLWKIGAYQVYIQYQRVYINLTGVTGGANAAPFALTDNAWHHIAFTYDGAMIMGYLDGVLMARKVATGAIAPSANSLRIGWDNDSAHYKGTMDNLRIYNQALSLSQVQADMDATAELPPPKGTTIIIK